MNVQAFMQKLLPIDKPSLTGATKPPMERDVTQPASLGVQGNLLQPKVGGYPGAPGNKLNCCG